MASPIRAGDLPDPSRELESSARFAACVYSRCEALDRLAAERFGGDLGGRLLLGGALSESGSASLPAASIAGAASLSIDPDPERLKAAIRNNLCDFMVNSLDEALRILKNEIRRRQPVSVGLQQELSPALEQIVERGVQPDLLDLPSGEPQVAVLLRRGAVAFPSAETSAGGLQGVVWSVAEAPARWMPKIDALAAAIVHDDFRLRWLRLAPRYLGRRASAIHYLKMSAAEFAALREAIHDPVAKIEANVEMRAFLTSTC